MPSTLKNDLQFYLRHLLENKLIRRIVKNSGYLFSSTGVSAGLSMLQGILAARLLGVASYGILGTITMFTSVVNKLASFRIGELVVKYVGQFTEKGEHEKAAATFKAAALLEVLASLLAFGLIWLLAPLGAQYFAKDATISSLFVFYGLIVLTNLIYESSTGLLQIFDRFRRIALVNILQSFVTLMVIGIAYFLQGDLVDVLLAYIIGKVIGSLGVTITSLAEASRHWGRKWWRTPLRLLSPQRRELVHFAISTNISATINLVNKDSEILWVSLFRSPLETGYYKLALALANMVQMPVSPMPQATYPEISREAARENWTNVRYILRQGSILAGLYSLVTTLGLILLGNPLIRFVYSQEYLPAFPALIILLAGFLAANTLYWRRVALLALGRPDFPAKLNLALAGLKILGILLLVPTYGYLASASLLAGFYLLGSLISLWKIQSLLASKG